jgi:hypothetical protein
MPSGLLNFREANRMNKKSCILLLFLMPAVFFHCGPFAYAQDASPYNDFRKSRTETRYGEKRPVASAEEAKKVLIDFFREKDVRIGQITEKELFFEAEIRDKNNELIDKMIVDKRTGRVRSIY